MNRGPDENFYDAQAQAFRAGRFAALRDLADEYVAEPKLAAYPSPIRWLWVALLSLCPPVAQVAGALLVVAATALAASFGVSPIIAFPLLVTSPLRQMLSTGKLQDTTVALATVLAVFAAHVGSPLLVLALVALLCLKEASVFCLPAIAAAWLLGGHPAVELAVLGVAGFALWVASLAIVFGPASIRMLKAARSAHGTKYTLEQQRGAAHRLLVDLAAISPAALVLALIGVEHAPVLAAVVALLIAAHALAPVRNVRLILAAELLIRCLAAVAIAHQPLTFAAALLVAAIAVDIAIGRRTKAIYDPVTSSLTAALGMTKA